MLENFKNVGYLHDFVNLLRLAGLHSIQAGLQTVMHDITALLAMQGAGRNSAAKIMN